jgi:hypothetical protein
LQYGRWDIDVSEELTAFIFKVSMSLCLYRAMKRNVFLRTGFFARKVQVTGSRWVVIPPFGGDQPPGWSRVPEHADGPYCA